MTLETQKVQPNKHLSAFFTFIALLPPVYFIPSWLAAHVSDNQLVVTVLAAAIIVPIITYVELPIIFWLWRRFR